MRDAIIQRTMAQHVDLDWQAWRPAIVYINGEYKGMLNIRERSNEDNIYTNYDGLDDSDPSVKFLVPENCASTVALDGATLPR
jgi:hypothetical protein